MTTILVVDDEQPIRDLIRLRLERKSYNVICAASGKEGIELSLKHSPDLIITDLRMPGADGISVIKAAKCPVILITGHGDKRSAIEAIEAGAFSFVEKPFDLDHLDIQVNRALEKAALEREKQELLRRLEHQVLAQATELQWRDRDQSHLVLGKSVAMETISKQLDLLSKKPRATVLLNGESGTGKEVLARELHRRTHQDEGRVPFLALNCSAVPVDLLESELFGHEKGSFTHAHQTRLGLAEAVGTGTLFLDEIADLAPQHQAKILRFLQERKFRRVGSNKEIEFQGRVVTATHKNLAELSSKGLFREDLYFRLHVAQLTAPPLRSRPEDLAPLIQHFAQTHGLRGVDESLLVQAKQYPWPGNIRELSNWIERAAIFSQHTADGWITAPLPSQDHSKPLAPGASFYSESHESPVAYTQVKDSSLSLKQRRAKLLATHDKIWIVEALELSGGNISAAAKRLGLDRKNLRRRMQELGMVPKSASTKHARVSKAS